MTAVTREMIYAGLDVLLPKKIIIGHEWLTEIYIAMHKRRPLPDDQRMSIAELTEREQSIIRFAVHRFGHHAREMMNDAAQDREFRHHKKGAVEAFSKDATDADALLNKLNRLVTPRSTT